MRYPVVLFDVGETLVGPREPFGAVYARVLGGLGLQLDAERLDRAIYDTVVEVSREIPPGVDRYGYFPGGEDEYWLRFCTRVIARAGGGAHRDGLPARAMPPLRDVFRQHSAWCVYPDVVPTLERLREAGVRLAVASNWDSRLPEVLGLLGLAGYFEYVGVSHLEGVEKPSPEFFRRILDRLRSAPGEALHVGDVPELDLAGARRAGIDGLLVDRRGRLDPALGALRDLTLLPRIVRHGLEAGVP